MKEAIFHPEAREEMSESFYFYETRLDGLGLRFLSAVEQTVQRISTHSDAGAPESGKPAVYIGEAECVRDRLKSQLDKDFWNQLVFFVRDCSETGARLGSSSSA